jgi:hypothetical protein
VPKLFNGRNKLFFFFGYQGFRLVTYNSGHSAVPTTPMRTGDFSQFLQINPSLYQIYDPYSVQPDPTRPGHVVRTPFPGNIVPLNRITNPMYKFYNNLLPAPNTLSANPAVEPNMDYYAYSERAPNTYNGETNRLDYNLSEKDRFFFRWSYNEWSNSGSQGFLYESIMPDLTTSGQLRHNFGAGVDWVHTFGATTFLDVSLTHNAYRVTNVDPGFRSLEPSAAGLPSYMDLLASKRAGAAERELVGMEQRVAALSPLGCPIPCPRRKGGSLAYHVVSYDQSGSGYARPVLYRFRPRQQRGIVQLHQHMDTAHRRWVSVGGHRQLRGLLGFLHDGAARNRVRR